MPCLHAVIILEAHEVWWCEWPLPVFTADKLRGLSGAEGATEKSRSSHTLELHFKHSVTTLCDNNT